VFFQSKRKMQGRYLKQKKNIQNKSNAFRFKVHMT
jgi:hypothetical protein